MRRRIDAWWEKARHSYPQNTLKAWMCDWRIFIGFCASRNVSAMPASPNSVVNFVDSCRRASKRPATIRRYLCTITRAHKVAGLVDPCDDEFVRLEVKALYRHVSARQRQAKALGWGHIQRFIKAEDRGIRSSRERALLTVMYDLMARRSELVALEVEDIAFLDDGTARALIRRSKTDQIGEGVSAYLTRDTVHWLQVWLKEANIHEGAIFRRIMNGDRIGRQALAAGSVSAILKRCANSAGFSSQDAAAVSGHSIRVGATQDLLALNIDLGSVMQAGRWKSVRMPMRYGEKVLADRGAVARAAKIQGRDSIYDDGAQRLAVGKLNAADQSGASIFCDDQPGTVPLVRPSEG